MQREKVGGESLFNLWSQKLTSVRLRINCLNEFLIGNIFQGAAVCALKVQSYFFNIGQTRLLFVYFHSYLNANTNKAQLLLEMN